jgi:hypothetical protein
MSGDLRFPMHPFDFINIRNVRDRVHELELAAAAGTDTADETRLLDSLRVLLEQWAILLPLTKHPVAYGTPTVGKDRG